MVIILFIKKSKKCPKQVSLFSFSFAREAKKKQTFFRAKKSSFKKMMTKKEEVFLLLFNIKIIITFFTITVWKNITAIFIISFFLYFAFHPFFLFITRFFWTFSLFYFSQKRRDVVAWGHTAVKTRHPVRSGKLSTAGLD